MRDDALVQVESSIDELIKVKVVLLKQKARATGQPLEPIGWCRVTERRSAERDDSEGGGGGGKGGGDKGGGGGTGSGGEGEGPKDERRPEERGTSPGTVAQANPPGPVPAPGNPWSGETQVAFSGTFGGDWWWDDADFGFRWQGREQPDDDALDDDAPDEKLADSDQNKAADKPKVEEPKLTVEALKPTVEAPKPTVEAPKPTIEAPKPRCDAEPGAKCAALPSERRPDLWRRGDHAYPIHYPTYLDPTGPLPSAADHCAIVSIALCQIGAEAAQAANNLLQGSKTQVDPSLAYHLRCIDKDASVMSDLVSEQLDALVRRGVELLTPAYRAAAAAEQKAFTAPLSSLTLATQKILNARWAAADPQNPVPNDYQDLEGWEAIYPVRPHPAWAADEPLFQPPPGSPPIAAWAVSNSNDYLELRPDPDDEFADPRFNAAAFRYMGTVRALDNVLDDLLDHVEKDGKALDPRLATQLQSSLVSLSLAPKPMLHRLKEEVKIGGAIEALRLERQAARRADAESRLVVFGETQRPQLYTKIGMDRDGRLIAITAETPHIMLICGGVGYGKTHLMRLLVEGGLGHRHQVGIDERADATIDGDVTGGTFYRSHRAEHLPFADRVKLAVKLLINQHQPGFIAFVFLRRQLYFKRTFGLLRHSFFFWLRNLCISESAQQTNRRDADKSAMFSGHFG